MLEATESELKISVFTMTPVMQLWRQEFKSSYIEDICRKTGLSKTYPQFLEVLQQGLEGIQKDVFVDLLNLHDLQMLKGVQSTSSSSANEYMQKRYLILTCL